MSDATLFTAVFIGVCAFIYFTVIRPATNDQKKHRQQMRDLRPGDRVVTTSGFLTTVKKIEVMADGETHLSLELADGVMFTAVPSAIYQRRATAAAESKPEQKGISA